jgi:hypothetical protein
VPPGSRMIAFILLLMAASPSVLDLVDEVYQIPAGEWRYVELGLKQQPATVLADFRSMAGSHQIRVALMRREDLEHLRNGLAHGVIAVTPAADNGALIHHVGVPGEYVLVVDNLGENPAAVHLKIRLDFSAMRSPPVTRISPERRLTVVLVSFSVFFGIVTWSARRLLRAVRR